jgi:hypothetical protein
MFGGPLWPYAARADAVTDWNVRAGTAAIAACLSPTGNGLAEARMYAMVHVAIHDALNAIDRRSRPFLLCFTKLPGRLGLKNLRSIKESNV